MRPIFYSAVFALAMGSLAWGNTYTFTQVSPVGQAINTQGGAAINSAGLVAWAYGSSIQTWNGSTVSTYSPGVNPDYSMAGFGLSDAGGVSPRGSPKSGHRGSLQNRPTINR
jgi:hypothetical protein